MKKHYLYSCLIMLLVTLLYDLCAKNTLGQAQELHKNIGKTLVQMRRENPVLEKPIYSLLDQVGQLNKLVLVSTDKRKKLKTTLLEEKQLRLSLNNEIEKSKSEINTLRQGLRQEAAKFLENKKSLEALTREKLDLQKKVTEVIAQKEKEKELLPQMKKADGTVVKPEDLLREIVNQPQPQSQTQPQVQSQIQQQNSTQSVAMHKKDVDKKA